ncbi:MAG: hypothetical protein NUV49_02050 [Patescibacteria group bacterium]|nr:hypothetical protein [Patescibacteria group bacterium]
MSLLQRDINYERVAFWALSLLVLLFVFGYSYFVNMTVLHVVGRQNTEQQISEVRVHVSELETTYFARVNSMNLDLAVSYGLEEAGETTFVSRKTLAKKILTLNNF